MRERAVEIAALEGDAAHQVDGVVVVRCERKRPLGRRRRLVDLVLVDQHAAVVQMEFADPGLDHQRAAQQLGGLVDALEILERQRQVVEGVRIVGIKRPAPCDKPSPTSSGRFSSRRQVPRLFQASAKLGCSSIARR